MRKLLLLLSIVISSCLNVYSQATSLTVDCQTPGWLSSMINYGDQQTVKNLKVTGYMNGTDIQFLFDLNQRSLTGVIDLEDVSIVKGGTFYINNHQRTVEEDNMLPSSFFNDQKKHIQKFVYPKTLISAPSIPFQKTGMVDSLIWTSNIVKSLNISNEIGYSKYVYLPEGIEEIGQIPEGIQINFPNTIKNANNSSSTRNVTVYSFINEPEMVKAIYESYDSSNGRQYWNAFKDCTFYIPKGTMSKYLNSEFATLQALYRNGMNNNAVPNGNTFIEYYDIESTEVNPSMTLYKGESAILDVTIKPDAKLVSWINYVSNDTIKVSIDSEGNITAKDYGQAVVSATPHVFIDGLETKTGSCIVNVIAHVEGVDMPATMSLHIGGQKAINAKTLPLDISDNQLSFMSSNSSIAEVTDDGLVVGRTRGTCTITATSVDGGYTATCEVIVTQPVEAVTLEKHSLTLKVGDSDQLFAQITPATADNKVIDWSSSDVEVVSVDASGNIVALKPGEAWVKAVSNDNAAAKDSCKVKVTQLVSGITLAQDNYTLLSLDETVQIEATVLPADATNKEIRWSSSNENVCVVNDGKVTPTGYGMAIVMASTIEGGYSASCIVKVLEMGDANGDCVIDKADAEEVAYYILGRPSSKFIFVLADVNEDKKISILDAVGIINIAIMKSTASARLKALDEQ